MALFHPMSKTATAMLVALTISSIAVTSEAQTLIFGDAQNGDFGGDSNTDLEDLEADAFPDLIFNGDRSNTGVRRADTSGNLFFANILLDGGNGFGGIDQVAGNGNPGLLQNNGSGTITATFFANNGRVVGLEDGVEMNMENDDILPTGAFSQEFSPGDQISYSFDVLTNGTGSPGNSLYDLSVIFDGGAPVSIASGAIPDSVAGTTNITGDFFVLQDATEFNVVATLINPGTGNDQIGLDNIQLELTEDVATLGDVVIDNMLNEADFDAIRDNFFNTGADDGSLLGEAIGAVDGVVDLDDFIVFRNAFLSQGGTLAQFAAFGAAVPEPSAVVTLICGLVLGSCRRTRGL